MTRALPALVLCVMMLGCGERSNAPQDAGSTADAAPAQVVVQDAAALAKQVMGCAWEGAGFAKDCIEWEEWEGSALIRDGKADAMLVVLLEDRDEKARWLGAWSLSSRGAVYQSRRSLAERVLRAAEKEGSRAVAPLVGAAAGKIRLVETELLEQGKALGKGSAALKETRLGFIEAAQFANRDALFSFTVDLAKGDPDVEVRAAAARAFWTGTPGGKVAEVCALWLDLSRDPGEELAARAANFAAEFPFGGGCEAQWGGVLGEVDRRARAGKAQASDWGKALASVYSQKGASAAQKARAVAIAKRLSADKRNGAGAISAASMLAILGR